MAEKTLKLHPLSQDISENDIRKVLSNFSIVKVHKSSGEGFIEF